MSRFGPSISTCRPAGPSGWMLPTQETAASSPEQLSLFCRPGAAKEICPFCTLHSKLCVSRKNSFKIRDVIWTAENALDQGQDRCPYERLSLMRRSDSKKKIS